jgi:hypothetical protein
MNKRVIFSNNGTLEDLTVNLNNYHSGNSTLDFIAAEDKLFIGSRFPFNSIYINVGTANSATSAMTIKYWDNSNFVSSVEVIDETSVGGASLAQSGYITFVPSRNNSWSREDTVDSKGNEDVTGLGGVTIYDQFWIEITFSADLDAGTQLSWMGDIFCEDADLDSEFPFLARSNVKTRFEAGKTDWQEQRVRASKVLIDDLISSAVINSGDNLLERHKMMPACVMKTAEIVFNAFGDDYQDNKKEARIEYKSRIKKDIFSVDRNEDGMLSVEESRTRQGRLRR